VAAGIGDEAAAEVAADMCAVVGMRAEVATDAAAGGDAEVAAGSDRVTDLKIAGLGRTHGPVATVPARTRLRKRRRRRRPPEMGAKSLRQAKPAKPAKAAKAAKAQVRICPPAQRRLRQPRRPSLRAKSW